MMLFSQREGFKQVKSIMQVDSMDNELRNGLWNALSVHHWDRISKDFWDRFVSSVTDKQNDLIYELWDQYFKIPFDTLHDYWSNIYEKIKIYFFKCEWYEVYDFIEFIANNYQYEFTNKKFIDSCNIYLERELSAYRFVGGKIVKITSEEEITEIEDALKATEPLKPVNIHLKSALDLLADRKSPDYRNSIKESISAVEAICKIITNNPSATLGDALIKIEKKSNVKLHGALKEAFSELYGWTSDAQGIRHGLMNEPTLDFEDAKFMLVACSAFINYLLSKASKAGIKL